MSSAGAPVNYLQQLFSTRNLSQSIPFVMIICLNNEAGDQVSVCYL